MAQWWQSNYVIKIYVALIFIITTFNQSSLYYLLELGLGWVRFIYHSVSHILVN
ncbi:hypothetical protein RhiirA5_119201 [Rhizophagus irregularis]|uniref:Uncharacterized protein n=1 Tax=Rhizophagus irregularis TaxID=588596 RepID=A0A2N0QCU5_9GLOM|nr:hypothetical protein RhiirA5_119201 [Rhizophagus irregularis]GET54586.1 hypothetical protein RIR_e46189_A0A2N0QCU5_9GLOM [Rhizophagus irregularis DAOM 181602=DAOM 197198]